MSVFQLKLSRDGLAFQFLGPNFQSVAHLKTRACKTGNKGFQLCLPLGSQIPLGENLNVIRRDNGKEFVFERWRNAAPNCRCQFFAIVKHAGRPMRCGPTLRSGSVMYPAR